jgi:hypothetical protein
MEQRYTSPRKKLPHPSQLRARMGHPRSLIICGPPSKEKQILRCAQDDTHEARANVGHHRDHMEQRYTSPRKKLPHPSQLRARMGHPRFLIICGPPSKKKQILRCAQDDTHEARANVGHHRDHMEQRYTSPRKKLPHPSQLRARMGHPRFLIICGHRPRKSRSFAALRMTFTRRGRTWGTLAP